MWLLFSKLCNPITNFQSERLWRQFQVSRGFYWFERAWVRVPLRSTINCKQLNDLFFCRFFQYLLVSTSWHVYPFSIGTATLLLELWTRSESERVWPIINTWRHSFSNVSRRPRPRQITPWKTALVVLRVFVSYFSTVLNWGFGVPAFAWHPKARRKFMPTTSN